MLHAVSFALADSINLLLIAVILTCAATAKNYRSTVTKLIIGDWLGVFVLSVLTMMVFNGVQEHVQAFLDSVWAGVILIIVGIAAAIGTWRNEGFGNLERLYRHTFIAGFVLGFVQSLTSAPFFYGLAHLSTLEHRWVGLFFYASLALSLPTLVAVLADRWRGVINLPFKAAGYGVAVFLIIMGVFSL